MLDLSKYVNLQGSQTQRREAVRSAVFSAVQKDEFTYTDILGAPEPVRSDAMEALDGTHVENNRPQNSVKTAVTWDGKPIRLVHVDPKGIITAYDTQPFEVPGTDRVEMRQVVRSLGNFADVQDQLPDRLARMILRDKCWPVQQLTGNSNGTVVEWRWLEKKALSANPGFGVRELYEEILKRPGFLPESATAQATNEASKTKQSKAAGESRPGV